MPTWGPVDTGADEVRFGASGPVAEVRVSLVRGLGDPAVRVPAWVDEDHRVLAYLDLSPDAPVSIGQLLRIRLGLPEPRGGRVEIRWLRVGDVLLTGVSAVETRGGESLVLAFGELPELAVRVSASEGQVVLVPGSEGAERVSELGTPGPWLVPAGHFSSPWTDVAVDPSTGTMASAPARHPTWIDADTLLSTWTQDDAMAGGVPEGPDFLARLRWGRHSPHLFALGDLAALHRSDVNLLRAAGDDCEALLAAGERGIRTGDAETTVGVARAAAVWAAWRAASPAERERRRASGAEPVDDACATVGRFAGGDPFDPVDPWPTARFAWTEGSPAAARFAIAHGVDPVAARLVVLDHARAHGTPRSVAAAAAALRSPDDPHPLTTALALVERGVPAGDSLAAAVARGEPVDPERLEALLVERPGSAAAACLAAAAEAPRTVPDLPEADCLAARVVRAGGVGAAADAARALLATRWPDLWVADPTSAPARRVSPEDR